MCYSSGVWLAVDAGGHQPGVLYRGLDEAPSGNWKTVGLGLRSPHQELWGFGQAWWRWSVLDAARGGLGRGKAPVKTLTLEMRLRGPQLTKDLWQTLWLSGCWGGFPGS